MSNVLRTNHPAALILASDVYNVCYHVVETLNPCSVVAKPIGTPQVQLLIFETGKNCV